MDSRKKIELGLQTWIQYRIQGNSTFDLNHRENENFKGSSKVPVVTGEQDELKKVPCIIPTVTEVQEIAVGSGIYEGKVDVQYQSQVFDTPTELHSDRTGVLEAMLSDMHGTMHGINSKQRYVFVSGYSVEGHQVLRDENIVSEIFRLSIFFMIMPD